MCGGNVRVQLAGPHCVGVASLILPIVSAGSRVPAVAVHLRS